MRTAQAPRVRTSLPAPPELEREDLERMDAWAGSSRRRGAAMRAAADWGPLLVAALVRAHKLSPGGNPLRVLERMIRWERGDLDGAESKERGILRPSGTLSPGPWKPPERRSRSRPPRDTRPECATCCERGHEQSACPQLAGSAAR